MLDEALPIDQYQQTLGKSNHVSRDLISNGPKGYSLQTTSKFLLKSPSKSPLKGDFLDLPFKADTKGPLSFLSNPPPLRGIRGGFP